MVLRMRTELGSHFERGLKLIGSSNLSSGGFLLALGFMSIFQSGCTVVYVEGGKPARAISFGAVKIVPLSNTNGYSYTLRGVGVVPGYNGVTVGYSEEIVVVLGRTDECRVFVFEPLVTSRVMPEWNALVNNSPSICQVGVEQ